MSRFLSISFGLLMAMSVASPNCWAVSVIKDFDNGGGDFKFLTATNWNDADGLDDDLVPDADDTAIINHGYNSAGLGAVTYDTGATTTVGNLVVGGDWDYPALPHTGDKGTDGELVMTAGKIIASRVEIARARGVVLDGALTGTGLITMTNAELELAFYDAAIGTRDHGELHVGLNAKVYNSAGQDTYWRLGNYGPSIDAGLEGDGLLNVYSNGTFNAHVIFLGDTDSSGELRVSDTGKVELTAALELRPGGPYVAGSAKVQMNGSSATLSVGGIEAANNGDGTASLWEFNADGGGVSAITVADAINITDNDLVVNLNGYNLPLFGELLLFDGDQVLDGDRLFGTFASHALVGSGALQHRVIYDQVNGDILIRRIPEPSTMLLMVIGMVMAMCAKRRA